jgi:hypothetical protein
MYRKYLFNIIRLQQKYSSGDTIPLIFCKYYKTVFAAVLGVLRAMKTARINVSLGEKLFSLYFKKIISSLQYKEVHFSSSGMYEHLLASSNQQLFHFTRIYS